MEGVTRYDVAPAVLNICPSNYPGLNQGGSLRAAEWITVTDMYVKSYSSFPDPQSGGLLNSPSPQTYVSKIADVYLRMPISDQVAYLEMCKSLAIYPCKKMAAWWKMVEDGIGPCVA